MLELVWLVDREAMFEKDWIAYLFQDIPHKHHLHDEEENRYSCPVFVFNASISYESFLAEFQEERVPYGVIHLSDETLGNTCHYLEDSNCIFAIRNYHHPIYSKHPKVITVGLGYKSGFVPPSSTPPPSTPVPVRSQNPWFHWCFVGAVHHQARQEAIRSFLSCKPYLLQLSNGGFNSTTLSLEEYKQTMVLSKFAICPIGQGNMDTFRLYEAMEAGCVPVVLSRTAEQPYHPSYWHAVFMLPSDYDIPFVLCDTWQECLQRMEGLMQNPATYYDLQTKMTEFWDHQKVRWKQRIGEATKALMSACSL